MYRSPVVWVSDAIAVLEGGRDGGVAAIGGATAAVADTDCVVVVIVAVAAAVCGCE